MNILNNSFGIKPGEPVAFVATEWGLSIKRLGGLSKRPMAPLARQGVSITKLDDQTLRDRLAHITLLGAPDAKAVLAVQFGLVGALVYGVARSLSDRRHSQVGCRITHPTGDFVELICTEKEFDQIGLSIEEAQKSHHDARDM